MLIRRSQVAVVSLCLFQLCFGFLYLWFDNAWLIGSCLFVLCLWGVVGATRLRAAFVMLHFLGSFAFFVFYLYSVVIFIINYGCTYWMMLTVHCIFLMFQLSGLIHARSLFCYSRRFGPRCQRRCNRAVQTTAPEEVVINSNNNNDNNNNFVAPVAAPVKPQPQPQPPMMPPPPQAQFVNGYVLVPMMPQNYTGAAIAEPVQQLNYPLLYPTNYYDQQQQQQQQQQYQPMQPQMMQMPMMYSNLYPQYQAPAPRQ
jgi:hypothetical protein